LELSEHVRGERILLALDDALEGGRRGGDLALAAVVALAHRNLPVGDRDRPRAAPVDVEDVAGVHSRRLRRVGMARQLLEELLRSLTHSPPSSFAAARLPQEGAISGARSAPVRVDGRSVV